MLAARASLKLYYNPVHGFMKEVVHKDGCSIHFVSGIVMMHLPMPITYSDICLDIHHLQSETPNLLSLTLELSALLSSIWMQVHLDYLQAGANIIVTASYQATIQGLEAKGYSREESEALLRRSVEIAVEARDAYYDRAAAGNRVSQHDFIRNRGPVLVAASAGSYGAFLADGSEYSGDYGNTVTLECLKDFHRRRVQILAESGADLIAFETIPNKLEAKAYAELLEEEGLGIPAWFSFTSKDGINVVSGDSLIECASIADSCKQVVAIGINCTPPRFISGLIQSIQKVSTKPILVYPNSGETYDGVRKEWLQSAGVGEEDFVSYAGNWRELGASLIGGCCRTTPNTIRAICRAVGSKSDPLFNTPSVPELREK